jgi:hypothetical protein
MATLRFRKRFRTSQTGGTALESNIKSRDRLQARRRPIGDAARDAEPLRHRHHRACYR